MIDNSMGLAKIKASGVDLTELKSFYLPYSKEDGSINRCLLYTSIDTLPLPAQQRTLDVPGAALAQRGKMGHAQQDHIHRHAVGKVHRDENVGVRLRNDAAHQRLSLIHI